MPLPGVITIDADAISLIQPTLIERASLAW